MENKMDKDFITLTIGKTKNIALIAHDKKKAELIKWCKDNKEILEKHTLCGTGTTARMVVEGQIDFIVFFSDPLTAAPHDPDVKALLRIAQVYDIPMANNKATADFMIRSEYMDKEYNHDVINFRKNIEKRAVELK